MLPIGVFDSGVGGLTVFRKILKKIPNIKGIYYGDTARVPYGGKPKEELLYLADIVTNFLIEKGAKIIVDACNSTSAIAIDYLKEKYNIPVIGVIDPGVRDAVNNTGNGRIGLIATEATVKSKTHFKKIKYLDDKIKLFAQPCPKLVPLIEQGILESSELKKALYEYLIPLKEVQVDTLILGCTHYPFIYDLIQEMMGSNVKLIDPATETVNDLIKEINKFDSIEYNNFNELKYFVSGSADQFSKVASILLPGYLVEKVDNIFIK